VKLRIVITVAVAVLLAGTVGFAQEPGRTERSEGTFAVQGQVMGPCGATWVVAQYAIAWKQMDRYDEDGVLVQSVLQNNPIGSSLYYLGNEGDPAPPDGKLVVGLPAEVENVRVDWVNSTIYDRGNIFHVTVPGYGTIFSAVGQAVFDMGTDPWTVMHSTPKYWGDLAALCDYLNR
jgi:hypothetical protein